MMSVCLFGFAQTPDLNPQVQVTNEYKSSGSDVLKQDMPLSVPDTVSHIEYNFDYSVFDNPYRGAYEFAAYNIQVEPEMTLPDWNSLYVRAGAGYPLNPELYAAFSARVTDRISLSASQDLSGFAGKYYGVGMSLLPLNSNTYDGYDLSERFGMAVRFSRTNDNMVLKTGYRGLYNSDCFRKSGFHSVYAAFSRFGNDGGGDGLNVDVRYSEDHIAGQIALDLVNPCVKDLQIGVNGTASVPVPGHSTRASVDYAVNGYLMPGLFREYGMMGYMAAPHIVFDGGWFGASIGFKVDYYDRFGIAPDIRVSTLVRKLGMRLSAGITGGAAVNTYSSLKEFDHFFNPSYSLDFQSVNRETVNASLRAEGHIGPRFSYDLRGGWKSLLGQAFESVTISGTNLMPKLVFLDCSMFYADLTASWKSEHLEFDTRLSLRRTSLDGRSEGVDLPVFASDSRIEYNFRKRVFVGLTCVADTPRNFVCAGNAVELPAFVDLGAFAEYRFNGAWSLWLKGGNLLNTDNRVSPLHVDQGLNFTLGVCLNL